MNKETIEVPRAWLERLLELSIKPSEANNKIDEDGAVNFLLGYIESAEGMLK